MPQTTFTAMRDATREDYRIIGRHSLQFFQGLPDRILRHLSLLHDIGDTLASANHAELAATVLEPFVTEKNHWIVKHHAIFQGYYFFHHLGLDRNMRDRFRDHPYWRDCAEFCEKFDQNSFDPTYDTLPLDDFEPAVRKVFAAPRKSIYIPASEG
jgi:predicted HD phosphohydrolase